MCIHTEVLSYYINYRNYNSIYNYYYIYIYIYILYIYIYIYIYVCICIYINIYIYIYIHICIYAYICINLHQKRYLEKFLIYLMNWSIFFLYSVCVVIFGNLFGSASYYVHLFMLFLFLFFFRSFIAFNINIGDTVRQHTSNW